MDEDRRAPGPGILRKTAGAVLQRYRLEFGESGQGIDTAYAGAMWHIIALSHLILGDIEFLLKDHELSHADVFVLAVLLIERDRPLRPSDLASILSVTPAAISLRIAKLTVARLVLRSSEATDRRNTRLALTPEGVALTRAVLEMIATKSNFAQALAKQPAADRVMLETQLTDLHREMDRRVMKG